MPRSEQDDWAIVNDVPIREESIIVDEDYLEEVRRLTSGETMRGSANYHTFIKRSREETLTHHPNYSVLIAQSVPPDLEERDTTEMTAMIFDDPPDDE